MRALQRVVFALGLIPIATGGASLLLGTAIIPGGDAAPASVESELRFYAVWWMGAGILLVTLAPRLPERGREFRAVCALLFLGGLARALGIAADGAPDAQFVVLMVIELVLAVVLAGWHWLALRANCS